MYSLASVVERSGGTISGNNATHTSKSYVDVANVEFGQLPPEEVDEQPYFLFIVVVVVVVVVAGLLVYRSRKQK